MNDDGDMAEMYLTEKKQRKETTSNSDQYDHQTDTVGGARGVSKSAPVSPVGSTGGVPKLHRAFSTICPSKIGSLMGSSSVRENIDQLEMLLEAYFVFIDTTLTKLLSVRQFYFSNIYYIVSSQVIFGNMEFANLNGMMVM